MRPAISAIIPPGWLAGSAFNPLRHIDPWGTIVIPAVILLFSGGACFRLRQAGSG